MFLAQKDLKLQINIDDNSAGADIAKPCMGTYLYKLRT